MLRRRCGSYRLTHSSALASVLTDNMGIGEFGRVSRVADHSVSLDNIGVRGSRHHREQLRQAAATAEWASEPSAGL